MSSELSIEILMVEDDRDDIELTLHALRKEKLANCIHVVRDGEEALNFIFCEGRYSHRRMSRPPGLILLDLHLPKISGAEVLEKVRNDPRTSKIPVFILSGSHHGMCADDFGGIDVNGYIQKPVDFHQLHNTVKCEQLSWLLVSEAEKIRPNSLLEPDQLHSPNVEIAEPET